MNECTPHKKHNRQLEQHQRDAVRDEHNIRAMDSNVLVRCLIQ
jgi:hypothetical protein